jgi:septal ring factor EnvC (AmiA/AmiB activator)
MWVPVPTSDDLDENLKVFDMKLRHMREDIAAIEASNNALELQSRNNAQLLGALQGLLAQLELEPAVQRTLESSALGSSERCSLLSQT